MLKLNHVRAWRNFTSFIVTLILPVSFALAAPSADGTTVPPATRIIDAGGNVFRISSSGTVLRNGYPAGYSANVVMLIYKNSKVYQQNSAGGFWYYNNGGWVSSSDPRTSAPTQPAQSADGTTVPSATQIVDASGAVFTISSSKTVLRNGDPAGYSANVTLLVYKGGRVYQQNSAGGFWYYDGVGWVASSDPRGSTPTQPVQSADGTTVPSASQIVDASGNVYTISSSGIVLRNGSALGYSANVVLLVYKNGRLYQQNSFGGFWYYDTNNGWVASSDPRTSVPTPTAPVQSANGTTVPPASQIVDASGNVYTINSAKTVLRNGQALGYTADVELLIYKDGRVYQQNSFGGFWYYDNNNGWIVSGDPRVTAPPPSTGGSDIAMPMPNPIPPDSIQMTCNDGETQTRDPFFVENNKWGTAAGMYGPNNLQCAGIGAIAADGSVSAKWTWNYSDGASEVKGYPAITYGQRPGHRNTSGSVLPKVVNSLSAVSMAWNTTSIANGKGHNAFDIWLTTDGVDRGIFYDNNITHEIMISTDNWGEYGDGFNPAWGFENDVTIDGKRFRVTKADNFPPGGVNGRTWRFIVFKMLDDRPVGSVNFMAFIQYMKSKGLISGNEYMNSIEYGTEQEVGSGTVKINGYKIDVR